MLKRSSDYLYVATDGNTARPVSTLSAAMETHHHRRARAMLPESVLTNHRLVTAKRLLTSNQFAALMARRKF
jgi:hypothetical protein